MESNSAASTPYLPWTVTIPHSIAACIYGNSRYITVSTIRSPLYNIYNHGNTPLDAIHDLIVLGTDPCLHCSIVEKPPGTGTLALPFDKADQNAGYELRRTRVFATTSVLPYHCFLSSGQRICNEPFELVINTTI